MWGLGCRGSSMARAANVEGLFKAAELGPRRRTTRFEAFAFMTIAKGASAAGTRISYNT